MQSESIPADTWRYTDPVAAREKLERIASGDEAMLDHVHNYVEMSEHEMLKILKETYPCHFREMLIRNHSYRAKRYGVKNETYTVEDIDKKYAEQSGRCHYCADSLGGIYDFDHKIPLSRGGGNVLSNIVLACEPCNQSKHAKTPKEFDAYRTVKAQPTLFDLSA